MKKPLAIAIAGRVQELREKAGLSQQEVAERGELSLSLVAKLEQGKKGDPRASTLLALATALGVKPGALLDELKMPAETDAEAPEAESNGQEDDGKDDKKKSKKDKKKKKSKTKV